MTRSSVLVRKWASMGMFAACTAVAPSVLATDFHVTTTEDTYVQGDGVCSLREAVDTANYNDCWEDCGCGTPTHHHDTFPSDTVFLAAGQTYTLESSLNIWDSVSLYGDGGNRPTIQAAESGSHFSGIVGLSDAWEIRLSYFRLTNFRAAALVARENAWVIAEALEVTDNFLQGLGQNSSIIAFAGAYMQLNYLYDGYNYGIKGGGLFVSNSATVDLNDSFIYLNESSQYGGGIHVQGTLNCEGSLIAGNSAGIAGGGVYVTSTGNSWLDQCTVLNNTAPQSPNIHRD